MAKRYKQSDIPNFSCRIVFFDANIIIYLFWPVYSKRNWAQKYASIFGKLLANKNKLAVNSFVLSEVINRILRIEWETKTNKTCDFKSFRDTKDGRQIQNDIFAIIVDKVLSSFSVIDRRLTADDIKKFLTVDALDFTDKIICDVCRTHNMILLTNDADFTNADVDILSANPKLA